MSYPLLLLSSRNEIEKEGDSINLVRGPRHIRRFGLVYRIGKSKDLDSVKIEAKRRLC